MLPKLEAHLPRLGLGCHRDSCPTSDVFRIGTFPHVPASAPAILSSRLVVISDADDISAWANSDAGRSERWGGTVMAAVTARRNLPSRKIKLGKSIASRYYTDLLLRRQFVASRWLLLYIG